jgi:hypothetical protein
MVPPAGRQKLYTALKPEIQPHDTGGNLGTFADGCDDSLEGWNGSTFSGIRLLS